MFAAHPVQPDPTLADELLRAGLRVHAIGDCQASKSALLRVPFWPQPASPSPSETPKQRTDKMTSQPSNDYVEILNLIYRYPELIDGGDFEGIGLLR